MIRLDPETRLYKYPSSLKIKDTQGNIIDFNELFKHLELLLHDNLEQIYREIKTIREEIAEDVEDEDVEDIGFKETPDNDIHDE